MMLLALAAALLAPHPGKLHLYKDWIVGCDNTRSCEAVALVPEDGDPGDYLMLTVTRDGVPGAVATLDVPLPDHTPVGARYYLTIDGKSPTLIWASTDLEANVLLTRGLLDTLAAGSQIALTNAQGKTIATASLGGLAASLLAIDDQQGRVGTSAALKAVGTKPDVASAPAKPLIVVPARSNHPARTITAAMATKLIGPDNAKCEYSNGKVAPESWRLDNAHTAVVINHPCGNGAYNFFSSVYILDESGPPHPAAFDADPGMGEAGDTDLTNGGWDPKTQRITSYAKGRGIGDCGTLQSYAWDGTRFRLSQRTEMSECRGSVNFIRTWTARVPR